jgi:hypothetical protein
MNSLLQQRLASSIAFAGKSDKDVLSGERPGGMRVHEGDDTAESPEVAPESRACHNSRSRNCGEGPHGDERMIAIGGQRPLSMKPETTEDPGE